MSVFSSRGLIVSVGVGQRRPYAASSSKFSGEGTLEDGLPEAGGALEVGGDHRLQLLHHAQPPLHFRHDPRLLGEAVESERAAL